MKILITGGAGFLGKKIITVLGRAHDIIATDRSGTTSKVITMDITDKQEVMQVISEQKPDAVIHCAAMSDVDACEEQKELAMKINRDGTVNIAEACNAIGALMVYISTDFIFDGEQGNYKEEDEPNPLSYYAKTKLEGEQAAKSIAKKLIVIRPEVLYGYNGDGSERSFTIWVYQSLKEGKEIRVVDDQYNTPTLTDDIAQAIGELIKRGEHGIWHIAGPTRLSRYDMAFTLAEVFGFDTSLIKRIKSAELKQKALRPRDSSLNTEKLNKEGITMHSFREGMEIMKQQIEGSRE